MSRLEALLSEHSIKLLCVSVQGSRGDLLLSLCYNPTANTITVSIIKARNLKAMDIGGTSGITPVTNCGNIEDFKRGGRLE